MTGNVTRLWISRPVIAVIVNIPIWRPNMLISSNFRISPPTRKMIPTGEYLRQKENGLPTCTRSDSTIINSL